MPKISVILSVRNQGDYLNEAISSILNQTFKDFEFIIIDDASTNLKIPKDRKIIIIHNPKPLGLTKSLNIGLKIAKGEYIARMDADDISAPTRLEEQVSYLNNHPNTALVGSWVNLIDENGKLIKQKNLPTSYQQIKSNLIKGNQFYHPALLIRKDIFKELGYYNEKYYYSQDYELVLRIASKHEVVNIPKPLIFYRVNSKDAISFNQVKKQAYFALQARLKALKDYNYPKWQLIYLLKPLISYATPKPLLLLIYKMFFFKHEA